VEGDLGVDELVGLGGLHGVVLGEGKLDRRRFLAISAKPRTEVGKDLRPRGCLGPSSPR
jgi:hypothetical protein